MEYVAGILGGLLLLGLVFKLVDSKSMACPGCGSKGTFSKFLLRRCTACKAFIVRKGDEWLVVKEGFIAKIPQFPAFLSDLKDPRTWQIPWSGQCCVCRKETVRSKTITVVGEITSVVGPHVTRATYSHEFYHCPDHLEGVRRQEFSSTTEPDRDGQNLEFQAFDTWREFVRLNSK